MVAGCRTRDEFAPGSVELRLTMEFKFVFVRACYFAALEARTSSRRARECARNFFRDARGSIERVHRARGCLMPDKAD